MIMEEIEFKEIEDTEKNQEREVKSKEKSFWPKLIGFLIIVIFGLCFFIDYIQTPPKNFPTDVPFTISEGATLKGVAGNLKAGGYIRSELAFFLYFMIHHDPDSIKASIYIFPAPENVGELANQLTQGNYSEGLIKFTHIEGESIEHVAINAADILTNFDKETFITLTKPNEGKLFPETYLIPEDYTAEELAELLLETFDKTLEPYRVKIEEHPLTLDEIIILASILEREANSVESMKIVSGILQNRLTEEMPLQVDSSIEYILDKPLSELVAEDLKIDSPYNTYLNNGLPPTPIGNPGLDAIMAVLEPIPSDYMFYITGNDGEFYYAKTFDEHRINIERHLR